jgi:hypothetical protein
MLPTATANIDPHHMLPSCSNSRLVRQQLALPSNNHPYLLCGAGWHLP